MDNRNGSEDTELTLKKIDNQILDMLNEGFTRSRGVVGVKSEAHSGNEQDSREEKITEASEKQKNSKRKKSEEQENQKIELESVYSKVSGNEDRVFKEVLDLFSVILGFRGGLEKIEEALRIDFNLGDIKVKVEALQRVVDRIADIKTSILFLKLLTKGEKESQVEELEFELYRKALLNYFGFDKSIIDTEDTSFKSNIVQKLNTLEELLLKQNLFKPHNTSKRESNNTKGIKK
jgi:chorismate mutase